MPAITVRLATLSDASAITGVHCSTVDVWEDPITREATSYERLDLYGRWRNGGPWMSVETCAVHLNAMLLNGHVPLVAEVAGKVVGEAEYFINREPSPFVALHLSLLYIHRDWQRQGVGRTLVEAGIQRAQELNMPALTTQPESDATGFYSQMDFRPWRRAQEMQLRATPATGGAPLTTLHHQPTYAPAPAHLALRIGRYQCGTQDWETLWPELAIPKWKDVRSWVWSGHLEGIPVTLGLREQLLDASQVDGYAWLSPDAPLAPAVAALQTLSARKGFKAVDLLLCENVLPDLRAKFKLDYQATVDLWQRIM